MNKNMKNILKKINKKIDALVKDKDAAEEIKSELAELDKGILTDELSEKLEQINEKLETVENNNKSLQSLVEEFAKNYGNVESESSLEKAEKLDEFLKNLGKKLDEIATSKNHSDKELPLIGDDESVQRFKEELTFFQNELESGLNENFEGLENILNTIISEVKEKITDLQETVDRSSENQLNTVISDVKQLKADINDVADSIRHINVNAILRTEEKADKIIDLTQKAEQSLIAEINALSSVTAKSALLDEKAKETVSALKNEISLLKNHIFTQIKEVLTNLTVQDDIKLLAEDTLSKLRANSTETEIIRKNLKVLKQEDDRQVALCSEIREILAELSEYELNENADKIDIIYENLSLLNTWVENSDRLSLGFGELREDFDLNSDKIDIIYENISYLNEWVKALNKFTEDIEIIKKQCYADATVPEKIKEIYENLSVVKDWGKKADALSLQVKALSVQIDETESTINSKNLSDMKKMFAQMNEDMANVSARTNKLIIESDKQNEVMKDHIFNLQEIIALLEQKSEDFGFEKVFNSIETLESHCEKSVDFENGMTESFIYLADWIDRAGKVLNSVKQQLTVLDEIREQQDDQLQKATAEWNSVKDKFEDFVNLQNEKTEEIKDAISKESCSVKELLMDTISKESISVKEVLTDITSKLSTNALQSELDTCNKTVSSLSSKIEEDFNMFQLQQEYALGQLQKIILLHDEEKQDAIQQNQISLEQNQALLSQGEETVNQIRQLFENCSEAIEKNSVTLENIVKTQENSDLKLMQLNAGLQGAIQQIIQNQTEILAKQDEILAEEKNTSQKFDSNQESKNSIDTAYNVIQGSYAEINENLHTIADLIEQNEKNSQQRMVELSYEKVDDSADKDEEIKELLNHIAEQNEIIAEKTAETEMLAEKINSMETKLSSLEQYMGKLIEYLEED